MSVISRPFHMDFGLSFALPPAHLVKATLYFFEELVSKVCPPSVLIIMPGISRKKKKDTDTEEDKANLRLIDQAKRVNPYLELLVRLSATKGPYEGERFDNLTRQLRQMGITQAWLLAEHQGYCSRCQGPNCPLLQIAAGL